MNVNDFFQSKTFKTVLGVIFGIIVILLIFSFGMAVAFRKARFSYKWGENYHQNFGGPRGGFFNDMAGRDFIGAHGTFGQIIKIDGSTLVIRGSDNVEKIALVKDDAVIKRFRDTIKPADLKVDEYLVVIGEPNEAGQIEAKFIRLMPTPGQMATSTPPMIKFPRFWR